MPDVVVIGAGVIGLTTAVCLSESGLDVRVDSDRPPEGTTSAAAGAMWDPYLVEPAGRVAVWSRDTLAELTGLCSVDGSGIRLVDGTQQSRTTCALPSWARLVGARPCEPGELRPGFVTGWRYRAPLADMPRYLEYLVRRLTHAGGRLRGHRYTRLDEPADAPVVVNCTGTGARDLAVDPDLEPVRGQLVVAENPGIDSFFCDDTPKARHLTYIYPQGGHVLLGGTAERGRWEEMPDEAAASGILRRCTEVEPMLEGARVLGSRTGLRPSRSSVRLEAERRGDTLVVHNYGHGGAGLTLSWACAREADRLVRLTV